MTKLVLKTEVRSGIGKEANKKLRKTGLIPAVFYQKDKAQSLQMNELEFLRILKAGNQLIDMDVEGKKKKAIIKDIQYHPVSERIVHVDFQGVTMSEIVHINVPLKFVGTPAGVREGGLFEVHMHDIEVKCKAGDIPQELTVDISQLVIGDTIHIKDLQFGELEITSSHDMLVAAVIVPKLYEEAAPAEAEEGEVEEGEETEEGSEEESEESGKE